ncbi:Pentatricopeptide repeat (PPR) superfamily protein [Euphorbia peplus]|nr:Pentatricopeptide repeat (PPR) superfamily protein [Euphorbia peplus]
MKFLPSFPKISLIPLLSSSSPHYNHQIIFHPINFFSSSSTKWNSPTNVIITHPILLIMESCTSMIQLKQIQTQMTVTSLITHTFPFSRVLTFCALAKNGDLKYAHLLFSQFENPNTYIWNTMIRGYSNSKLPIWGFGFFCGMVRNRVEFNCGTFVFALKVCEQFSRVFEGECVHCVIWKMGFDSSLLVQNGLIHFYTVFRGLSLARKVFDEMPVKDVFSWTSMVDCYSKCNCYNQALDLFNLMVLSDVEPNEVTMISVLSACSKNGDLSVGKGIYEFIKKKNLNFSLNLINAVLDMYVKCGCVVTAREIFNNMRLKDVFSWTTMINGYARSGELGVARNLFNEMPERNVVSWTAMISGYSQNNKPQEALEMYHNMVKSGLVPVENTLVCVLSACGQLGNLELGKWIHLHEIENKMRFKTSVITANALIDMYAKCGVLDSAVEVFNNMTKRDSVSWNSMISAYATHGDAKQALVVFEKMIDGGFNPNAITFVGVLSACSHGGLVIEGRAYFRDMERVFGIIPKGEHYGCMIDLLGRVGLVDEAYEMIQMMPMEPSKAVWGALLNGCRMYGNVEMAKYAAGKLIDLDPGDSGVYAQLSATCVDGKRWNDVRMIGNMMRESKVKKVPGHSLIEIERVFHEFSATNESYPV